MSAVPLAQHLRGLGIGLSLSAAGKLRVEAPPGTLTAALRSAIEAHRGELLADSEPRVQLDPRPDLVDGAEPRVLVAARRE